MFPIGPYRHREPVGDAEESFEDANRSYCCRPDGEEAISQPYAGDQQSRPEKSEWTCVDECHEEGFDALHSRRSIASVTV